MEQNQFDIKKVQVHRTSEAIIFEIAFAIVAVIVWGIITWMLYRAPDIVPTHFDAFGKPNAYGSPTGIIIPCIVLTIGAVVCMATAYFPRHINMPFKITNSGTGHPFFPSDGHHLPVDSPECGLYDAGDVITVTHSHLGGHRTPLIGNHLFLNSHL